MSKLAVIAVTGGLVATVAIPAYALTPYAGDAAHVSSAPQSTATQLYATATDAETISIVRDSYGAKPKPKPVVRAASTASNRFVTLNPPAQTYSGAAVVAFAKQFVGVVPYGMGNNPNTSFSCDGLVQYVFSAFGISLPRIVSNQAARGVRISAADAQPGDLVVWPGHNGIYAGGGTVIDSPTWGRYVEHRAIWGNPYFVRLTR